MNHAWQEVDADVLVIGGGLAGCWAALRARELGAAVVLVDKGPVGYSGCSTFASGDIACPAPGEDTLEWLKEVTVANDWLNDQWWSRKCLEEIFPLVQAMERFGVQWERQGGEYHRHQGRGNIFRSVVAPSRQIMEVMVQQMRQQGVKVIERVMITDLLVEAGRCRGALGFALYSGDWRACQAAVTVLAAGGCGFAGTFYGHQTATGDSHVMAYRAGVIQHGFEFPHHNTTHCQYDVAGMSRFVGFGGRFRNRHGEAFVARYEPEYQDRAPLNRLAVALAKEVEAGNGPIYFDLTAITPENYELTRRALPHVFKTFDRAGIDIRKDVLEWTLESGATYSGRTGCAVDEQAKTNLEGLYAAGGAAAALGGTGGALIGNALMGCCVTGYTAGENAALAAREIEPQSLADGVIARLQDRALQPSLHATGISPGAVLEKLQHLLFPYDVLVLKSAARLEQALAELQQLQQQLLPSLKAADPHQLMQALEVENIASVAEACLRSSLLRTETRGSHYRRDCPQRDDQNWLKWVQVRLGPAGMEVEAVPMPPRALAYLPVPEQ